MRHCHAFIGKKVLKFGQRMSQLHTVIKDGHHSQYPTELVLLATDVRLVYMYMRATLCVNFAVPTIVKSKYVFFTCRVV